jgi:hypothetical protein
MVLIALSDCALSGAGLSCRKHSTTILLRAQPIWIVTEQGVGLVHCCVLRGVEHGGFEVAARHIGRRSGGRGERQVVRLIYFCAFPSLAVEPWNTQ